MPQVEMYSKLPRGFVLLSSPFSTSCFREFNLSSLFCILVIFLFSSAVFSNIFGESYPLGLNVSIFWLILITIIFVIVLPYTRYGNRLQAVGRDPITALSQGISPTKTKLIAFLVCAVLASFAGVLSAPDEGYVYSSAGNDFPLESIAAAVLGGCIVGGGIGSIWGAVLGVFLLASVRIGLIMIGAPPYWYITFVGIVLILMMTVKSFGKGSFQK